MSRRAAALLSACTLACLPACGNAEPPSPGPERPRARPAASPEERDRFPTLVNVRPVRVGDRTYDFVVMVASAYDSPRRYADGWRITTLEGKTLGEKRLAHDHADEQPFTRRQAGVRVPDGIERVRVEGHDSRNGYGGEPLTVALP